MYIYLWRKQKINSYCRFSSERILRKCQQCFSVLFWRCPSNGLGFLLEWFSSISFYFAASFMLNILGGARTRVFLSSVMSLQRPLNVSQKSGKEVMGNEMYCPLRATGSQNPCSSLMLSLFERGMLVPHKCVCQGLVPHGPWCLGWVC